jgi:hypothetical protein
VSRAGGFVIADVDVNLLGDAKLKRLARAHADLFAAGVVAYLGTVLASWRAGERVTIDDAWPPLLPLDEAVPTALREAGLLDGKRRVTARAWASWFVPAFNRREQARASGSRGGRAPHRPSLKRGDPEGAGGRAGLERRSSGPRPVPFRSEPVRTDRSEPVDGQTSEEVESDVV